jgi:hypothetical protein
MPIALTIALIVIGIAQGAAFIAGLSIWAGLGTLWGAALYLLAFLVPILGPAVVTVIAWIGATDGWGWTAWQAAPLGLSYVVLMLYLVYSGRYGWLVRLGRRF